MYDCSPVDYNRTHLLFLLGWVTKQCNVEFDGYVLFILLSLSLFCLSNTEQKTDNTHLAIA